MKVTSSRPHKNLLLLKLEGIDTVEQGERLLRENAPCRVFRSHIRRSPKVDESTWTGEPVVTWSPRSAAAQDYRAFVADELMEET